MTGGTPPTDVLPASQVAELINSLAKALRAYHMYLPNNPIYQRASDNLRTAFQAVCRLEGIIPALETAHAFAYVRRMAGRWAADALVLVCLSGRGDKDVAHVAALLGDPV